MTKLFDDHPKSHTQSVGIVHNAFQLSKLPTIVIIVGSIRSSSGSSCANADDMIYKPNQTNNVVEAPRKV